MPSILQVNQIEPFSGSIPNDKVFIKNRFEQGDHSVSATGYAAHAQGVSTNASGNYSHAEGIQTTASGDQSHSEGKSTHASGNGAHAEGIQNLASGEYSHASGKNTVASGNFSTAEGEQTDSTGIASHAEGKQTNASADYAHAEGFSTTASGLFGAHAEGTGTVASNSAAHAEGSNTTASGNTSHAEGLSTTASGQGSHAEGDDSIASGFGSHAEGGNTQAVGPYSHAQNSYTVANGDNSSAAGRLTVADGDNQFVVGMYNISSSEEGAFIVGNGNFSFNKNLLVAAGNEVQVFGKTSTETIQISNGAFDGYVLTSDALGNGSWQSAAGLSDTFVTGASLAGTDLEIDRNNGQPQITVDLSSLTGVDTFVTAAALNGTDLEVDRNQGQPQLTVDLSSLAVDTFVISSVLNGTDLEINRNNGEPQISVDLSALQSPDTFVTTSVLNGTDLEINRNNGEPQISVDLSSLVVDTNNYVTSSILNGTDLELSRLGLPTLTTDLSSLQSPDTFVTGGTYDAGTNIITLSRNDGGTVDIAGIADSYLTGAVLNGSTLELSRNEGLPTLSVDLSSLLDVTTSTVDAAADPVANADVIFYSGSSAGGTIYLSAALNIAGKKVVLIRKSTTAAADLGANGGLVNGVANKALPTALYSATTCISDGTNWYCNDGDPI